MAKRLLHYDPFTGVTTYHDYDHSSKKRYITTSQDVNPVLDYCKNLRSDKERKRKMLKGDNYYHYATVPVTVIQEWLIKHGVDAHDPNQIEKVDKLLAGDYKYLTTVDKI